MISHGLSSERSTMFAVYMGMVPLTGHVMSYYIIFIFVALGIAIIHTMSWRLNRDLLSMMNDEWMNPD